MYTLQDLIDAGMVTTTTFIRWAIVVLTNHVSVQERLHAEIDSVISRQRLPTLDDRSQSVDKIICLAHSENLQEWLYIFQCFCLYLFFISFNGRHSRPDSSKSNGPIFTKF